MRATLALFFLLPCVGVAQVPAKIGYQGRLLKADGSPETGSVQMGFTIFDQASGGTALWTEQQNLALSDGYYATLLGIGTALSGNVFGSGERFLEVSVGGSALSPRQPMASVPYALVSTSLSGGAVNATSVSINGKTVIDSTGKLTGPAGYSVTAGSGLSVTGTSLSLPTCAAGQVLKFNNGWACAPDANSGGTVSSVTSAPNQGIIVGGTATAPTVALAPVVMEKGGNFIPNGFFRSGMDFWSVESGAGSVVSGLTDAVGDSVFRNASTEWAWVSSTVRIPVDPSATYEVRGSFRRATTSGAAGGIFLAVRAFDASGANISQDGTWWYYPLSSVQLSDASWQTYSFTFGASSARPFPTTARYFSVGAILNYDVTGHVAGNRQYDVTGLGIFQVPMANGLKMWAGRSTFAYGGCGGSVTAPCNIDISGGAFTAPPVCTLTMVAPDATGYTEHMIIKTTTANQLQIWRGLNNTAGSTMIVNWTCMGQ